MTEQLPKDPVRLPLLKDAIERYVRAKERDMSLTIRAAELAHTWRLAFEWHVGLIKRHSDLSDQVGAHLTDWIALDREEEEGLAFIREKLQS